jgi:hypothetical protein
MGRLAIEDGDEVPRWASAALRGFRIGGVAPPVNWRRVSIRDQNVTETMVKRGFQRFPSVNQKVGLTRDDANSAGWGLTPLRGLIIPRSWVRSHRAHR